VDHIAILEIDHAPVNALDWRVRTALQTAIVQADEDPAIEAVLIMGLGRCFVAGADVREFDAPPREPLLNDVLLRVEACAKPVVAAMHGPALGGGLELALASHYRCAAPDVSLGFPEINLGLLPGSGGTQRLPRLIGPAAALELMLSGKPIGVERAQALGLIDLVIHDQELLAGAIRYVQTLLVQAAMPRRLRERSVDVRGVDPQLFAQARTRVARESPEIPAAGYIIECIEAAIHQPFETALALSRRRFEGCRTSQPARALRHLFFAERPSAAAAGAVQPRAVRRVAVVGAGTMGTGIAISLLNCGFEVVLIEPDGKVREAGLERIQAAIQAAVAKGRLSAAAAAAAIARVQSSAEISAAGEVELAIEAVFENLRVKQEVFAALDRACAPGTVLATNTSTLDVDAIAGATGRAEAVVGMHFFSPANVMRLVEIVRGHGTHEETIATTLAVTRRMGKPGIVVGNGFGFVGNRMLYAYGRENQYMLLEGASPAQIDGALTAFGMAMGPNAVGDLAGLDVGYRVRRERKDLLDDPRYYRVADLLVEAGRLGQKTARGAFRYEPGSRLAISDPEVEALIEAEATRLGIARRPLTDEEITQRCLYALINEGARVLEEGIAASAADIDAIWCNGYGFPRYRGGPLFYADSVGLERVVAGMEKFAQGYGGRHWTPAPLLQRLVQSGGCFCTGAHAAALVRPTG